jgi:DNA-binding protein H-NS
MKSNNIKKELEQHLELNNGFAKWEALKALAYVNHLEAEVERLNNECRKTRRDLLNEIIRLEDQLETAKFEAVEEYAERLKEEKCHYTETEHTFDFDGVTVEDIDNVKKEMVGDNK